MAWLPQMHSDPQSTIVESAVDSNNAPQPVIPSAVAEKVYRHSLPIRVTHWLNVVWLLILVMSGLQIFNAHPALYWGDRSDRDHSLLSIRALQLDDGQVKGITTVLGHSFDTTGMLGYSNHSVRAFPSWSTIPSGRWLAMGRQWHLFVAWLFVINGLLFVAYASISRHIARDLIPTGRDLMTIGTAARDHLLLRHPKGEDAKRYNVLQKLAYLSVLFGLAPLIIVTGLTMSPMIDTAFPWLLSLFGGRQSARTIHFVACFSFVGFMVIHVVEVFLTGFLNNMRSMLTGWWVVRSKRTHEA